METVSRVAGSDVRVLQVRRLVFSTVCIVVVVLCALLSYVYLLYYVGIVVFFYFRCRTAG